MNAFIDNRPVLRITREDLQTVAFYALRRGVIHILPFASYQIKITGAKTQQTTIDTLKHIIDIEAERLEAGKLDASFYAD